MKLFSILVGVILFVMYVGATRGREGFEVGKTPTDFLKEMKSEVEAKNGNLNIFSTSTRLISYVWQVEVVL
jgi:hypothetical protein